MTFSSELHTTWNALSVTISSTGTVNLTGDAQGNLTGNGSVKAVIVRAPGAPNISYTPLTGEGGFRVTGKRVGKYLGVTFGHASIPCKGTMTVAWPHRTETREVQSSFDPAILTLEDNSTLIEGSAGVTTTEQVNLTGAAGGTTGATSFTIVEGSSVLEEAPVDENLFPDQPNLWTLEVEVNSTVEQPPFSSAAHLTGSVEFPAPVEDGPARGEGPARETGTGAVAGPMQAAYSWTATGQLILDGQIRDGTLTFVPRMNRETFEQRGTSGSVALQQRSTWWEWDDAEPVSIPMKDGAELAKTYHPMEGLSTTVLWRLKGRKVEVWEVAIDCWDRWTQGFLPKLGAGVDVHWLVDTQIEIENDQWKSGIATISVLEVNDVSDPPGVFTVNHTTSVSPPYEVQGNKYDDEVHLRYPRNQTSSYRVDFDLTLSGGDVLAAMTAAGVRGARHWADELRQRGTMKVTKFSMVPEKNTVYMLPLRDGAVLTTEYGETITIRRVR